MLDINLLRDDERRYQGHISSRFIRRAVLSAVVALVVLGGLRLIMKEYTRHREYCTAAEEWAGLKGAYLRDEAAMAQLDAAQSYRAELKTWANARLDAGALLAEMQRMIPDTIQLIRLSWEDEFVTPPKGAPVATNAPPVSRALRMRVAGRAVGKDAQMQVEKLIGQISGYMPSGAASNLFARVELRGMQSAMAREPGESMTDSRDFDLDAQGIPRAMP